MTVLLRTWIILVLILCGVPGSSAAERFTPRTQVPVVSIIIDDVGDRWAEGQRAVELNWPVSLSFLPRTPYAERLAKRAHELKKEVLLHLPMQANNGKALGPGGLTQGMSRAQMHAVVQENIRSIPFATGVNNHMGSLLTRQLVSMQWFMDALHKNSGLFFVDSRTTAQSVALETAKQRGVPAARRDIFLDPEEDANMINAQFDNMLHKTESHGSVLAIAHPYPVTLEILEARLAELDYKGISLVTVSTLINLREWRARTWQASLSPSPKAARSSKPSP